MRVRILGENDTAAWVALRLRALETEPLAFGKSAEEQRATPLETMTQRFRNTSPENFTLGAFQNDALAGMATFVRDSGLKEKHKGHIFAVYVAPEGRGYGMGRALLANLVERVHENRTVEQVLLSVAVCQEPARRLYRSLGFKVYGTEPRSLKVGTTYVDEELMILQLG